MAALSLLKRREIIDALRRGTVPRRGLEVFAVGLSRFEAAIGEELEAAASGRGSFKAVRGEYGTGKTFFARWVERHAQERGFATALVQISETDTPLYRMETIYRRALESMQTREWSEGAFRSLIDRWFYDLEEEALARPGIGDAEADVVAQEVGTLLEKRLASVSATHPQFAAALRACHTARLREEHAIAEGLMAWLMGQPNVGADIKRAAGIKGDLDHRGASGFFRGLLAVLQQTGRAGFLLVLDEVETIQRVRADSREKSLNGLRQLLDDLDGGHYPGMYVLITGTPQFFDGPQGVRRLPPLQQSARLSTRHRPPRHRKRSPLQQPTRSPTTVGSPSGRSRSTGASLTRPGRMPSMSARSRSPGSRPMPDQPGPPPARNCSGTVSSFTSPPTWTMPTSTPTSRSTTATPGTTTSSRSSSSRRLRSRPITNSM